MRTRLPSWVIDRRGELAPPAHGGQQILHADSAKLSALAAWCAWPPYLFFLSELPVIQGVR